MMIPSTLLYCLWKAETGRVCRLLTLPKFSINPMLLPVSRETNGILLQLLSILVSTTTCKPSFLMF